MKNVLVKEHIMHNQVILNMMDRRSVREYKPDMPAQELIDEVMLAGTYAATGSGKQSPIIIEVKNKEVRDELMRMNADIMGKPGTDPFYGAPVVLIVLADKERSTRVCDGSLVMGNMMNAAHSLGLASCWIHRAKEEFETPYGKQLLEKLGITGEYEGIGHCILGFAAHELPEPAARKENYIYHID